MTAPPVVATRMRALALGLDLASCSVPSAVPEPCVVDDADRARVASIACAPNTLTRLPPATNHAPGRGSPARTTRSSSARAARGSSRNSSTSSLSAYVGSPSCGAASSCARRGQVLEQQAGPERDQSPAKRSRGVVGLDRRARAREHGTGVEPGLDLHEARPRSRRRRRGSRARPAPRRASAAATRSARSRSRAAALRAARSGSSWPNATTTPTSAPLAATSSTTSRAFSGVQTGRPSSIAACFTGDGSVPAAARAPAVGLGDDERDVVARVDERAQRRHGRVRRSEVDEPHRARLVASERVPPAPGRRHAHALLAQLAHARACGRRARGGRASARRRDGRSRAGTRGRAARRPR